MAELYGLDWGARSSPLKVEMNFVRNGGHVVVGGKTYGEGLFHHFRALQMLLWPEGEDHHRWSDLILAEYLKNRITIVMGPKDTSKTHTWARIALTDYWTYPDTTLWLVSSTDLRGLELRVWGDIKDLFNRARDRHKTLSGNILEHRHGIFTDRGDAEEQARDIRKGIICIPCIGGSGEWVGIEKYAGIKQKRRRLLADELQFMKAPYIISVEHLDKGDFKMGGSGNPIGQNDPLDKLAEPKAGWGTEPDTGKTDVWPNRWGGVTINLDGRDNLNNDPPANRFPYILNNSDIERTAQRHGKDSAAYWNQVIGRRKPGLNAHRVLTREMCVKFGAFESSPWSGSEITEIYALDAAFGGDRAVGGSIQFGQIVGGQTVIKCNVPEIIPIRLGSKDTDEEQLAYVVRAYCQARNIPPAHVFFDAGMRATLVNTLSRLFSPEVNAVNFGGTATPRPVSADEYLVDRKAGSRRLKRCDEHYSKFVTELWFSVRLVVLARQMRDLPDDVADEFYQREWYMVSGDRYELETKKEMKERVGFSPDKADWLAIAVEGARRLGFMIENLPESEEQAGNTEYLERELMEYEALTKKRVLNYR